ncbi:unnamed protein product [Pieris brassicae]|uniref:Uncharacterized protein n=1 Tax=Pieris brassicae TaxID=7116 RepID=A0A9P0XFV8_PIEBR|nr:unnamed protein product [Pieris brassicae]
MDSATIPLSLEPVQQTDVCEKRLWIGNLDTRVNEYVSTCLLDSIIKNLIPISGNCIKTKLFILLSKFYDW